MSISKKYLLMGSAVLFAGFPVLAAETAGSPAVVAPAKAYVNCPGITSVPMTADAEQALPMRQVATLACGEPVSVLADNEGYTAHIRTSDGKEGYVARMYLTAEASHFAPRADAPVQPSSATPNNGVVRWSAGAPGCDEFISKGRTVESATANGITVQVSLQDTGWKLRATVAVSNNSESKVFVLPSLVTLDELKPGIRNLRAEDPAKLSRYEVNHMVLRTESNAQPSPSAVAYHNGSAPVLASVAYRTSPAPDYLGDHTDAASVQALALKQANLAPGQKTAGVIWFARDPNSQELSMRLSVGDVIFDFPFSFQQKK
jgi:hypothetical protein